MSDLGRVGRSNLLTLVRQLQSELADARQQRDHAVDMARRQMVLEGCLTCSGGAEYKEMLANLTATQTRCTELLVEVRAYRASGICLPGWWCPCAATSESLGIFNGSMKEVLTHCRACGRAR